MGLQAGFVKDWPVKGSSSCSVITLEGSERTGGGSKQEKKLSYNCSFM